MAPTYIIEFTDSWEDYTIMWEDFTPGDANGTPDVPNGDNFMGLNINLPTGDAYGTSSNIEFAIDNVSFVE